MTPGPASTATQRRPRAAVVGAGLSGLTAAYRLQREGWEVDTFESEATVGGRVQTVDSGGYLSDTGATAIGASYDAYFSLASELGLADELIETAPWFGIYREGRVHHLRLDRMIRSGLTTRLLSPQAKLRALRVAFDVARARLSGQLDYADMRKAAPLDTETSRAYAERALGPELTEYLCEPIVRTMLIADADEASRVELFSGLANIFGSELYALRGGQGRLPRALAEEVGVELGCRVTAVSERPEGVEVQWRDAEGGERAGSYDACVLACPLGVAAAVCPDRSSVLAPLAEAVGYTRCITVAVGTTTPPESPAMLIQLPACEDRDVALIFLDHNKAADRAPAGHGLFGCCWSNRPSASWFERPDEEIVDRTLATIFEVFPEVRGTVDFTHVTRWSSALPRTQPGVYRMIGDFNASLDPADRIQFAADYMSAAGQHTAIEFGTRAAGRIAALEGSPPNAVATAGSA
jgi:protoporphyrinogen/coproporphyrinogen III oxidase